MKMMKISNCLACQCHWYFFDGKTKLVRFVCRHPNNVTKYRIYRIINRKLALKGDIPTWCKLEDYKCEK